MLWLAMSIKLMCEVALMSFLGRWVLGWLAGPRRDENPFYRLLGWIVRPALSLAGRLGKRTADGSAGLACAALLLVWLAATFAKIHLCLAAGAGACR